MKFVHLKACFLIACLFVSAIAMGQTKKITGKVVSDEDNKPLSGVNIIIAGKGEGTQTAADGTFSIDASAGETLNISSVGFVSQSIKVGSGNTLNVSLKTSNNKMDEVVVVGYGTAKRSKVTSSIAKLDNKILNTGIRSNPAQALAGTIPGLRVSTGTGRPGSLPSIILRGGTNFDGSGSPLILMDGEVRSSLSDINPEDIGSIEVLKDAGATAIYGARASNGVILITSKRGKAGTSSISLKVNHGISYLNVPYHFLSAEDYIKWSRMGVVQAIINGTFGTVSSNTALSAVGPRATGNLYKDGLGNILDGNYDSRDVWSVMRLNSIDSVLLTQPGWKQMKDAVPTNALGNYDPNGTYADLIYKDFNYGSYGLYNKASINEYNVGMNGGNDKGAYYANVGYYDEGGLSLATFYKRMSFTLNGDYKIKSWLKSESSLQYNRANWRDQSLQNGESSYWGRMLSAPPTMRGTNANGDLILGRDANDGNPIINIDKYKRFNQSDKFTLNQSFQVDIMKGLYFKIKGIWMYDESVNESFNQDYRTGYLSYTDPNKGWNRTRATSSGFDRTIRQTYNAIVDYKKSFLGKNNIDALVGFEYFSALGSGVYAGGAQAPTDVFGDLQYTLDNATTQTRSTDSYHNLDKLMSGFGTLAYDWDGKYIANFTVRRDGTSRLEGNNQFGTFPAASIGWMVHREKFMESTKNWLSYLKLRASWGKSANIGIGTSNAVGLYEVQGAYGSVTPYNGVTGFLQTSIANPSLQWEKTNTKEIGADMAFLKNRINFSIAYYNRVTDDKLAYVNLPTSSGISSIRTNNGSMRNKGLELDGSFNVVQKRDLTWQISANAAWNKNTVLKLPYNGNVNNRQGGQQIYDPKSGQVIWVGGLQEGQEWGELYGFVPVGIIRTPQDLANYNKIDDAAKSAYQNGGAGRGVASQALITQYNLNASGLKYIPTQLGDMMWKDIDKNDTIDYRDMAPLGRTLPRCTGGFNTTLNWKGFSLFARFDFALGYIQQDFMQNWSLASAQGEFNATDIVKQTWTPDNPNAKYPRYTWADQLNTKNFDRPSNIFYVNSSYLAFREVSLSYTVPVSIISRAKMSSLRLTITGQNLGYITNSLLKLPERTGQQTSAYTIPTQLVLGANLTF